MSRWLKLQRDGDPRHDKVNKWKHSRRWCYFMEVVEYSFLAHHGLPNLPLSMHPLHHGPQSQTRHCDQPDCRVID